MTPIEAYCYARENYNNPDCDLQYYEKIACMDSHYAYCFACYFNTIYEINIEYCQKYACKTPLYALFFACDIPGANIEYCRKACEHDKGWLYLFDKMIIKKAML